MGYIFPGDLTWVWVGQHSRPCRNSPNLASAVSGLGGHWCNDLGQSAAVLERLWLTAFAGLSDTRIWGACPRFPSSNKLRCNVLQCFLRVALALPNSLCGTHSHCCSDKPWTYKMCPPYCSTGELCLWDLAAVCPGTWLPPRGCFSLELLGTKCAFCKGCETFLQGLEICELPPLNKKELRRYLPASGECPRAVLCPLWEQGICGDVLCCEWCCLSDLQCSGHIWAWGAVI